MTDTTVPYSPTQAAFDAVLNAPDAASRETAWGNLTALASGGQYGNTDTIYGDLNRRASEQALSAATGTSKANALDVLERSALALSGSRPEAEASLAAQSFGLEPGRSAADYRVPPNVAPKIADEAKLGEIQAAAHAAGLPAALWGQAITEASEKAHLLADHGAYDTALTSCRDALARQYPDKGVRDGLIKAGIDYLNTLATKQPALREAADLLMTSPWGIVTAANLAGFKR